jgi:hypothetical protein
MLLCISITMEAKPMTVQNSITEDVTPKPEDFVKSIAEQGYRLETAIADLVDNSISAGADRIEVLLDTESRPFKLFIADNGKGMDEETLKSAMRFPSSSMEEVRGKTDLGRFGLGLKTASFSQTRHFTALSRASEQGVFHGRTWDVELLRRKGWVLKVENEAEVIGLLEAYRSASKSHLGAFDEPYRANTIIVWSGLYKFEDYIEEHDCAEVLKKELTEITRRHLSLVFHRFLERTGTPLRIRLNNIDVKPFNPFPTGARWIGYKNRTLGDDLITMQGVVLPTRSIDEVGQGSNVWVPQGKGLMDLEGIYIYRADRIILYGDWLELINRSQRMQLGRMRVEIGNAVDHLLHLNIAKSQVVMPYDIRNGFKEYITELKTEAEREYYNRTVRRYSSRTNVRAQQFMSTTATSRGAQMRVNTEFPLVRELSESLNSDQKTILKTVLRMVNTEINKIRRVHEDTVFTNEVDDNELSTKEIVKIVQKLLAAGLDSGSIKKYCIRELGYQPDSLPAEVTHLIN